MSGEFHEINDATGLLEDIDELFAKYAEEKLPSVRTEFESRALMYHILWDLRRFVSLKADFAAQLSESEKKEEAQNIRNGLNFAKKVLTTGECDMLILDEVLGLIDNHIIDAEELRGILEAKSEEETIILTGIQLHDETCIVADEVYKIEPINFKVY